MKKEEYNQLESNIYGSNLIENSPPCPDCGEKTTHPEPCCPCRSKFGKHIMKYHHTCNLPLLQKDK